MAWGAGARLEGLAHGEALPFTIFRIVEHDPERRRALRRPGRQDLCGNQINVGRHATDAMLSSSLVDFHAGQDNRPRWARSARRPRNPPRGMCRQSRARGAACHRLRAFEL